MPELKLNLIRRPVSQRSPDHGNPPRDLSHGVAADLDHRSLNLGLDLALHRDHHPLDRHSHLVDLDAVLANFELDPRLSLVVWLPILMVRVSLPMSMVTSRLPCLISWVSLPCETVTVRLPCSMVTDSFPVLTVSVLSL